MLQAACVWCVYKSMRIEGVENICLNKYAICAQNTGIIDANRFIQHMYCDLQSPKPIALIMIVSGFNTFERKISTEITAVTVVKTKV